MAKTNENELENVNPNVYKKSAERGTSADDYNDEIVDPFDEREIFGNLVFIIGDCRLKNNLSIYDCRSHSRNC
jgi:hypothetical protein